MRTISDSRSHPLDVFDFSPEVVDGRAADGSYRAGRIGEILVKDGCLEADDIPAILQLQADTGLRFGEAALRLRRIKPPDVHSALMQQFAGPHRAPEKGDFLPELVVAYQPASKAVEAMRPPCVLLLERWFTTEHNALAVVSPARGEGRSYFCANMAMLLAQLGRETLLIDADLRRPRLHAVFKLANKYGLSSMLAGRARPEEAIVRPPSLANLSLLPAGPLPPNPLELLSGNRFARLLAGLAQRYAAILIDTPADGEHADAQIVAARCRGAILVTRAQWTRLAAAQDLVNRLVQRSVTVVGSVLNRF